MNIPIYEYTSYEPLDFSPIGISIIFKIIDMFLIYVSSPFTSGMQQLQLQHLSYTRATLQCSHARLTCTVSVYMGVISKSRGRFK